MAPNADSVTAKSHEPPQRTIVFEAFPSPISMENRFSNSNSSHYLYDKRKAFRDGSYDNCVYTPEYFDTICNCDDCSSINETTISNSLLPR
ncbi:unnamed protein product [Gongylonema pulchrum]|uniref:Uncharacterized protein n=1 Tax=Gongylonema pulchrum TaxID=637853 RepID=A0A183DCH6_9BILA|nr:unnamed protein product [Gongylonema pulchrum]